jgi:Chloroplast import apparatus Tic20-like
MTEPLSPSDRVYASLPYILPISASVILGSSLFSQVPFLLEIYSPFIWIYRNLLMFPLVPFLGINGEFVIFILLFTLVLRNPQINRFVRFNVIQAFLLEIILFIEQILVQILGLGLGGLESGSYLLTVLVNTTFMGIAIACSYAIVRSAMGVYSEIPGISAAALIQSDR